jgi:hypothetical protein
MDHQLIASGFIASHVSGVNCRGARFACAQTPEEQHVHLPRFDRSVSLRLAGGIVELRVR